MRDKSFKGTIKRAVWKPVEYEGLEDVEIAVSKRNPIWVRGTIISVQEQRPFLLDYLLICDRNYSVGHVRIDANREGGFELQSDKQGNWFDYEGKPLPELQGCIDVDITATPFTNTLPIRRLDWNVGQSEMFKMAWISVPEMTVVPNRQRYTCLEKSADGAKFRFESPDINFEAVITVDADGLVVDYPGLFTRLF